ncbi:hypothetical protein ABT344_11500 [Micromonospora carbonacea]|uniref:hypothetical protein n=1 Tax=Micromonospora carbonacea TaxID=47853 RepID=UPI00332129D6
MFADPTGTRAATFAAVFVALYVAHQVADHWVQTQHQADCKGQPGWAGRIACAALGTPRPGHDDNPSLGTGAYALDQSWHIGWLFVAALFCAA